VLLHIGKSSFGWNFNFRAHEGIRSYTEWLIALTVGLSRGGIIVDEYGREMSLEGFQKMVDNKQDSKFRCHAREYGHNTFLDPGGFSFIDGEFS
jgi:hypothetical protein